MPAMPCDCPRHEEICAELEQSLEPCPCGGVFQKKVCFRAVHSASTLWQPQLPLNTSSQMHRARKKAGGGKLTGTRLIASLSRREKSETISSPRKSEFIFAGTPAPDKPRTRKPTHYRLASLF